HGPRPLRQAELDPLRRRPGDRHRLWRGPLPQHRGQGRRPLPQGKRDLGQADGQRRQAGPVRPAAALFRPHHRRR
ncbi:conserved hypothetical protein, partial [Ricinus communis]